MGAVERPTGPVVDIEVNTTRPCRAGPVLGAKINHAAVAY